MPDTFKSFRNATDHFMREALGGLVAAHPCAEWHDEGFVGFRLTTPPKANNE